MHRKLTAALAVSLGLFFFSKILSADNPAPQEAQPIPATEAWSKAYQELHESTGRITEEVGRNYFPEFTLIKDGHTLQFIQIDSFAAKVLKEADDVLLPYRQGIQDCVDRNQSEFRQTGVTSYEYFGWFLDNYVRTLVKSIAGQEEAAAVNGVREKKVTTDRAIYAFTRLLSAYLEERTERMKATETSFQTSDRLLLTSINDTARRVFRLDLSQSYDRKELIEKGTKSQPVLRELASHEGGADLSLGMEPINRLTADKGREPACKFLLIPRSKQVAKSN